MDGFLLVNKPKGITSFDAVYKVRKILTQELRKEHERLGACTERQFGGSASSEAKRADGTLRRAAQQADSKMPSEPTNKSSLNRVDGWRCMCRVKVGHGGTLDPAATGLLIIAIGKATKQLDNFIGADKGYEAVIKLGEVSTTEDSEGEIRFKSALNPLLPKVEKVLSGFIGNQKQTPPIYSALKVKGKRAYDLARQGKEVELKQRSIIIKDIKLVDYSYPYLKISCEVSKGTYIRSLARDIGEALNTGAYLAELKRTQIGNLLLKDAVEIADLTPKNIYSNLISIEID